MTPPGQTVEPDPDWILARDPDRLAALFSLGLLEPSQDPAFDRLVRLAQRLLKAPAAAVSLVDDRRVVFKSSVGLRVQSPWRSELPLEHSYCLRNLRAGQPLAVADAKRDPRFRVQRSPSGLALPAYLGMPLTTPHGHVLGSLCVWRARAHVWTDAEIATLGDLADVVMSEIKLRIETRELESEVQKRERVDAALRRSERDLRERLAELEELYRTTPVGLGMKDTNLCYVRLNERLAEMNGKPLEEQLGRRLSAIAPDIGERVERLNRQVLSTGKPILGAELEGEIPSQPGVRRSWLASYYPVKSADGDVTGVGCVVVDITNRKQTENALREREERFRLAVEAAGLIYDWDVPRAALFRSPGFASLVGCEISAIQSTPAWWTDRVHPDDRGLLLERLRQALRGEGAYSLDYRVRHEDGHYIPVWDRGLIVRGQGQSASRVVGYVMDLTQLKTAEEELRRARAELEQRVTERTAALTQANARLQREIEERRHAEQTARQNEMSFRALVNAIPDAMFHVTADGTFIDFKPSRDLAPVVPPERLLGEGLEGVLPADVAHACRVAIERATSTGRMESLEYELEHGDGRRCFESRIVPIGDGRLLCMVRDITERRRMQSELADRHALLRVVTDGIADLVFLKDRASRYLFVNSAAARFVGRDVASIVGKNDADLIPAQDYLRIVASSDQHVLERGVPWTFEDTVELHGVKRTYLTTKTPHRDAKGAVIGLIGISRDITELRRHEAEARRRQAELAHVARLSTLGEMAAGLAHELNQPLSAIATYARASSRMLRAGDGSHAEILAALDQCAAQAEHAGEVIRRMRGFIARREPHRSSVCVNDLVHEALQLVENELRFSRAQVQLELQASLPLVSADRIQIEQVLVNLLRNSLEAMQGDGPQPHALTVSTHQQSDWVQVAVKDTGCGISRAIEPHLFEPFQTTKRDGLGMGLAISRSIVEEHAGRLWMEPNRPQRGVTFWFSLPSMNQS